MSSKLKTIIFSVVPRVGEEEIGFFYELFIELEKQGFYPKLWTSYDYPLIQDFIIPYRTGRSRLRFLKNAWQIFSNHKWLLRLKYWKNITGWLDLLFTHEEFLAHGIEVYKRYKPDVFLVWNPGCYQFSFPASFMKRKGVLIRFMEWGAVPGTFIFTKRSSIYFSKKFEKEIIQVNDNVGVKQYIFDQIQNILAGEEGLNLYNQDRLVINQELAFWSNGKPKLLVLGLSEADSLVIPNAHEDRKIYLPFFQNSLDAALSLSNSLPDWDIVFKPHPNLNYTTPGFKSKNCLVVMGNPDEFIRRTDVTIAFGTKLEINVVLQGKPLILLGSGLFFGTGVGYSFYNLKNMLDFLEKGVPEFNPNHKEAMIVQLSLLYQNEYLPYKKDYPFYSDHLKRLFNSLELC